jgi:hypothetical protein
MIKNILLIIISLIAGALLVILGFLWISPRNTQVLKVIIPKTLFSLENAPTDSLVGEIASFSGKVAWQSRIAPVAILINSPVKLHQGEEVDTYDDGNVNVNFPNGVIITAASNTQVNFIQTLPQAFVVEQKQGSVSYSKTGEKPVSIIALDLLVDVNSGENTVLVDKDKGEVTVTVKTGLVTVAFNDNDNNVNVVSLKVGDQYVFNDNTKIGVIKSL